MIYADNCGACGKEFLSTDLIPVKIGSQILSRIKVCQACLGHCDPIQDYIEAAEILVKQQKQ